MAIEMQVMHTAMHRHPVWRRMRWLVWGGALALLALPWLAMHLTREVNWTALDFCVMGTMLGLLGLAFELTLRMAHSHAYVLAAFLMTWANLAVGIIGEPGDPLNRMFFGVLAVGLAGSLLARFKPRGMAWAMLAMAVAQGIATAVTQASGEARAALFTALLLAMWLGAAWLCRCAAKKCGRWPHRDRVDAEASDMRHDQIASHANDADTSCSPTRCSQACCREKFPTRVAAPGTMRPTGHRRDLIASTRCAPVDVHPVHDACG